MRQPSHQASSRDTAFRCMRVAPFDGLNELEKALDVDATECRRDRISANRCGFMHHVRMLEAKALTLMNLPP